LIAKAAGKSRSGLPFRRRAADHSPRLRARAGFVADDARIHAFDRLDEQRARALAILERRLAAD
jgi:hypothetical protein